MERTILKMMSLVLCMTTVVFICLILVQRQIDRTNVVLKSVVEIQFRQHLDTIQGSPEQMLRRFALGYELQRDTHIWDTEEWERILNSDLPSYFQKNPQAITVWENGFRQYWTQDVQMFMDDVIAKSKRIPIR